MPLIPRALRALFRRWEAILGDRVVLLDTLQYSLHRGTNFGDVGTGRHGGAEHHRLPPLPTRDWGGMSAIPPHRELTPRRPDCVAVLPEHLSNHVPRPGARFSADFGGRPRVPFCRLGV